MTKSEHPQGPGVNYAQPQPHNPVQQITPSAADVAAQMLAAQQMAQMPNGVPGQPQPQPTTMEYAPQPAPALVDPQMAAAAQAGVGQVPFQATHEQQNPQVPTQEYAQVPTQEYVQVPTQEYVQVPTQEYQAAPVQQPFVGQPMEVAQAQVPNDDYHYPQGQSALPDIPSLAVPPAMAPLPTEQVVQPASPPLSHAQQAGEGVYGDPSSLSNSGEQISQRLAQLQSQYDEEMSSEAWSQNAVDTAQQAGETYSGYHPQAEEFAAYPPIQAEAAPQQAYQQQQSPASYQEQPAAFQQSSQANQAQPDEQAYAQPPMDTPHNSYGEYGEGADAPQQQYDGPSIAQENSGGGGLKKVMFGGAFIAAIAVGGGAAYTYKYTDLFNGVSGSGSAPTIVATASPIRIFKDKVAGAGKSINKAMHNRLNGGSDRLLSKELNRGQAVNRNIAGARSGMLPRREAFGGRSARNAPRRVKTLIVRPDGTILRPAGSNVENSISKTMVLPLINAASIAKTAGTASTGSTAIRRMKTIGEASAVRKLTSVSRKPKARPVNRKANVVAAVSKPVKLATVAIPSRGAIGSPFVVQVTSRTSQTGALAAFADMQQKYPSLLGTFAPDIQRADLGAKGVWYRLRVGPVGSKNAAVDLCSSLKQAGHPGCFVRRK